jgi:serine/threonine protein kinase
MGLPKPKSCSNSAGTRTWCVFFGSCKEDGADDVLLITEFAPLGDLGSMLERLDEEKDATIPFSHKPTMLQQVAARMQALADARLIHRDLAARNILVFRFDAADVTKTVVKVSDFGLTVNGSTATHQYVQNDDVKPIRYLAPEALKRSGTRSRAMSGRLECWHGSCSQTVRRSTAHFE